jgi:hypothetical protein
MAFMRPTEQTDQVWQSDGLEIYVIKGDDSSARTTIRAGLQAHGAQSRC